MADEASIWAEANELFVEEEFEAAGSLYDQVIALNASNPKYYLARAANSLKQKKYKEVITDADESLRLQPQNHTALYRKGTAYFYLDEFDSSLTAFEEAKKLGDKKCDLWIRKCKAELRREGKTPEVAPQQATPAPVAEPVPAAAPVALLSSKVKDNWFQSNASVQITVFAKNLKNEDVDVKVEDQTVEANLVFPDGSKYSKKWSLYAPVVASEAVIKVNAFKVEINMKKVVAEDWKGLESFAAQPDVLKRENLVVDAAIPAPYAHSKPVDWDKLEQDVQKEEEEEKPEGQEALHKLFKSIYAKADPDVKRAMMKSYQTSGGTVLSTNWAEVSKKDYEKEGIQAPAGQEVRKW